MSHDISTGKFEQFNQAMLSHYIRARRNHLSNTESPDADKPWLSPLTKLVMSQHKKLSPELANTLTEDVMAARQPIPNMQYESDECMQIFELADRSDVHDAESVVALIKSSHIQDNGNGSSTLVGATEDIRTRPTLEPRFAFASGFLVDPGLVVTSAYWLNKISLDEVRFVFGYEMQDIDTLTTTIDNDEIYRGIRIIGQELDEGVDWAVVQLDRPVLNHPYVRIRRTGKIENNAQVHIIGNPSGLPKTFTHGVQVSDNTQSPYFVTDRDSDAGQAGSPVFNNRAHLVEGIVVQCTDDDHTQEICTRITGFEHLIPRHQPDCTPFNWRNARVINVRSRWKIASGGMWLLDFGFSKAEAERALRIIQHYQLNSQCFVGRNHASMEFYLVNGEAPQGALPDEIAMRFTPNNLEVQHIRGRWRIIEGQHWLMDFDQREDEARQALSYILRYGFHYMCFVGHPYHSMTYFP